MAEIAAMNVSATREIPKMSLRFVLAPLFVQVALTFVLMFGMAGLRRKALVTREVHPKDIALREPNWPTRATQFANAYHNQLELPILFYVLTILELITRQADLLFVILSWVFVVCRIVQAFIHTTNNRVMRRGIAFGVSALALVIMWIAFGLRLLL
jgi:hypothetical protein